MRLVEPQPLRVAIELAFGRSMNQREHSSLAAQLVRCYGLNNKHANPLSLHLTALDAARADAPKCLPPAEHMSAWEGSGRIALHERPAGKVWPGGTVWLSPDADELLTTSASCTTPAQAVDFAFPQSIPKTAFAVLDSVFRANSRANSAQNAADNPEAAAQNAARTSAQNSIYNRLTGRGGNSTNNS